MKQARESFFYANPDGPGTIAVVRGDTFSDKAPAVKAAPRLFDDIDDPDKPKKATKKAAAKKDAG